MNRVTKIEYYLNIAKEVASRSTCLRKHYGSVLVKDDEIISTGYNGAPRGCDNCCDLNKCYRLENNIPSGSQYERCRSVHAEQNALLSAGRNNCIEADMYIYGVDPLDDNHICDGYPCIICTKLIINSGIKNVYITAGGWRTLGIENVRCLEQSDMKDRYFNLFEKGKGI